jgi:hypothetical protein
MFLDKYLASRVGKQTVFSRQDPFYVCITPVDMQYVHTCVYRWVSGRSVYERHHLVFTFLVAVRKMLTDDVVKPDEWQFFLTNGQLR